MPETAMTRYAAAAETRRSLRDYLVVLFRRRWVVAGVAGPIIAFSVYGTLATVARYNIGAEVLIEARAVEDPSFEQRPVEYDIVMSGAAYIAQSIPVATKAAAALWDSLPALKARNEDFLAIESMDDLRDEILGGADCAQIGESNLLGINYAHADMDFGLMVVDALTQSFIDYNIEMGQNTSAIAYYDDQIKEAAGEIDQLLARRVSIFETGGLNAFQVNKDSAIQQMRALEATYYKAQSTRRGADDRYRGVLAAVAADPDFMPSLSTSGQNANLIDARSRYDKATTDLMQLRSTYQEESPLVQRQISFVQETRRIFHQIRSDFIRDLEIDAAVAAAEETSLAESLGRYRSDIEAYPAVERELATIDLQIEAKRELLKALQTKRGEVRLKVQGDQRISNITRLNEPSVRAGVAGGKKMLYLVLATLMSGVLGVLTAFLVDLQDRRIYDPRQAEVALELPVLGSISPARLGSGGE